MDKLLFPKCGIYISDVERIAKYADNKRHAAKLLGISERQFYSVIKSQNLDHLFQLKKKRKITITKQDLQELAEIGVTIADAAAILETDRGWVRKLLNRWNMRHLFETNSGKCSWKARRGYCG
jgi:hypothetical protein